jgi:Putative transposase
MTERAAHLVDAVLPWVPVRQWVLTLPYRLRYQMAWNHGLSRAVLRVYTRVLLDVYARGARECGVPGGRNGSVTVMQRAGSGLNVNLHFHTLLLDGVFTEAPGGALGFHPAPAATDADVAAALATIRQPVQRLPAAWSPVTRRRGRWIGSRTSPPYWRGSSGPRFRGGWR